MTASPFMFLGLLIVGLIGSKMDPSSIPGLVWKGFTSTPFSGYFWYVYLIGTFSYGTGLFGTLILLDKRENTFTIPANRVSSIIAGVIATYALAILYGQRYPSAYQLIGVALVLAAIIFLSYRSIVEKRAKLALVKQVVPATEAVESSDEMCSRAVTN
jgi:drug/metabolite transporter (DMT)-like permease